MASILIAEPGTLPVALILRNHALRQLSWAPTSLAAVALVRAGASNGFAKPLEHLLDGLPLETLAGVVRHRPTACAPGLPDAKPTAV